MKTNRRENEPAPGSSDDEDREWRSCRKEAAEIIRRILAERERLKDVRRRIREREQTAGATRGWTGLGKLLDVIEYTCPGPR
ncbi:MAG: hypothetical protein KC583_20585 [Myxococcales bacterium]|nr:hypothetical protein [Myxococcales bacterium]